MTVWKANIEVTIPKKHRLGSKTQSDKAWDRFHELVMQAIVKHVDFAVVKCVIIASPAFVKDKFYDWMMAEAVKRDGPLKPLRELPIHDTCASPLASIFLERRQGWGTDGLVLVVDGNGVR